MRSECLSPLSPLSQIAVDKACSGYVLSPAQRCQTCVAFGTENCPPLLCGSKGNRSLELLASCTGNLCAPSGRKLLWPPLKECLEEVSMASFPNQTGPMPTSVRKILAKMDLGSGVRSPFLETPKQTGTQFGPPPSPVMLQPFPRRFEYVIMGTYRESDRIMWRLSQLLEQCMCSGVRRALVNLDELGPKGVWMLTVSALVRNSGTDIKARKLLSVMNFVVESTSLISSDGATVIRYVLKSKVQVVPSKRKSSTLLPM